MTRSYQGLVSASRAGIGPSDGLDLVRTITATLPGAHFAIECADGMRLDPDYVEAHPGADAVRGRLARVWDRPAVKLLVRHPSAPADVLHSVVEDAVGAHATVTWSTPGLVEISATGVTKASALQRLCTRLGVPRESVVAFGDMPNDIPMLAWAGIAYAIYAWPREIS